MDTYKLLMSRYYLTDPDKVSTPVEDYRLYYALFLEAIKNMPSTNLVEVLAIVRVAKGLNIPVLLESSKYYCDKLDKNYRGFFPIGSGLFRPMKIKNDILSMDRDLVSKEELIEVLRFFRYLPEGIDEVTDIMLDDIFNQKNYYTNLQETIIEETPFNYLTNEMIDFVKKQKTFVQSVVSIIDTKAGIDVQLGRKFTNMYGNILQAIKIILKGQRGDAEFIIYVPIMDKGVYSLGNSKFIMTKLYEDYIIASTTNVLKIILRTIVEGTLTFTKAYKISQENKDILRGSLQSAFNATFYAKRKIMPTPDQLKLQVTMFGQTYDEAKELLAKNVYYFSPFTLISNSEMHLSTFETVVEHHKLFFKEYAETLTKSGGNILKNLGDKGYEVYRNFPLNNSRVDLIDPGYMNNKADFCIAYITPKKSLIEMNPFSMYNHQSFRNAASAYIIGHAFEVNAKPDLPMTVSSKMTKYIPSYNMLFVLLDYVDSEGLSTYDGQRLLHEYYTKKLGLFEGIKIAFQGYDKGVSRVTFDDIYCVINGVKHPLNVASPTNIASRKNFGVLFEGLYNAKKFFDGNTEQEERDFYQKPLQSGELMDFVEIFRNGESLGKHPVVMMQSFFVREIDSSYKNDELDDEFSFDDLFSYDPITSGIRTGFKSYKLGLEWFARLRLMGGTKLNKYLLGSLEKIIADIEKLESNHEGKLYKKNGAVTKRFQKEVTGFTSTVTSNAYLKPGHAKIYLTEEEFIMFMVNIKRVDKNYDVERAKKAFFEGKAVILPPALQLRNPSVDDANTIFTEVTLHRASKYAKHGYSEVNPIIWQRQGGDFDGDQVIFLFFPYTFRTDLEKFFGYKERNITNYGFEFIARDLSVGKQDDIFSTKGLKNMAKSFPYTDLDSFILWIGEVKKNKKYAQDILELSKTVQTKREVIIKASSNLMTTRISKQLIGVAKTITMKATFFIENFMERFNITDKEIMNRLRQKVDELNYELVQKTIDIQKHSDNLTEVIKTVLMVYRMSEAVSAKIEWGFYPTYRTYMTALDFAVKSGIVANKYDEEGNKTRFFTFKKDIDTKFNTSIMPYAYQGFIYGKLDMSRFAVDSNMYFGDYDVRFDTKEAGWYGTSDPISAVNHLIDVIDMEKDTYQNILAFTEDDMESINVDEKFYMIKKA